MIILLFIIHGPSNTGPSPFSVQLLPFLQGDKYTGDFEICVHTYHEKIKVRNKLSRNFTFTFVFQTK